MPTIDADRQHLDFSDDWDVVEWDTSAEYTGPFSNTFNNLNAQKRSIKGSDVVGYLAANQSRGLILVAEFKDYDHPNASLQQKAQLAKQAKVDDVTRDLLAKTVDTLCGATFAHDAGGSRSELLSTWASAAGRTDPLLVLFCVEMPADAAVLPSTLGSVLKKRLEWLPPQAEVLVTTGESPFDDLGIEYRVDP